MDLKEFLEDSPIIKKSVLAKLMYPTNKSAYSKLQHKLEGTKAGTGVQRITDNDKQLALSVLNDLADKIKKLS